jgi:catechol 2,3-dioxygenase-like lactoylglutathione lyase family enzyme
MPKYVSALIAVSNMARSRAFYEGLLGQKVKFDFGPNVAFEAPFAIHERTHFESLLGDQREGRPRPSGAADPDAAGHVHWGELYFEEDDLEAVERRLKEAGAAFVHPIREQPWGQRVFRCQDPDGHVVELGETMEATVRRLADGGMTVAAVAARTGMPIDFIESAIGTGKIS